MPGAWDLRRPSNASLVPSSGHGALGKDRPFSRPAGSNNPVGRQPLRVRTGSHGKAKRTGRCRCPGQTDAARRSPRRWRRGVGNASPPPAPAPGCRAGSRCDPLPRSFWIPRLPRGLFIASPGPSPAVDSADRGRGSIRHSARPPSSDRTASVPTPRRPRCYWRRSAALARSSLASYRRRRVHSLAAPDHASGTPRTC